MVPFFRIVFLPLDVAKSTGKKEVDEHQTQVIDLTHQVATNSRHVQFDIAGLRLGALGAPSDASL